MLIYPIFHQLNIGLKLYKNTLNILPQSILHTPLSILQDVFRKQSYFIEVSRT